MSTPCPANPCVQALQGCAYRSTSVNVYTVCCYGHMCMCKHAHLYCSASAAGWLTVTRKRVSTTPNAPSQPRAQHGKFRATTTPSQPQIRRPLPSPQRYTHIPELTCEINSRDCSHAGVFLTLNCKQYTELWWFRLRRGSMLK